MFTPIALLSLPLLASAQYNAATSGTSTMHMSSSSSTSTSSSPSTSTTTTTHDIDVGKDGLLFSPDSLTASTGDRVNFHFYPRNHSVAQSSFSSPCTPLDAAAAAAEAAIIIYSGFMPVPVATDEGAATMFSLTVNNTDNPIWLYCSQGSHCQDGMAMVVNPPRQEGGGGMETLEAYKIAAKAVPMSVSPPGGVMGGVLVANVEEGGADSSSAGASGIGSAATGSRTAGSATGSAASASATSAAAAAGLVRRPLAGTVMAGMLLAVGLGVWTTFLL